MKNQWDMLVVGSGLSGMVIAHEAAQCGKRVLILEKRDHIGGNIFDYRDQNGVLVQKYGPHVFFTDDKNIEKYISQFVPVESFYPECRTYIEGKSIPMPFNFASIDILYEKEEAETLKEALLSEFAPKKIVSVMDVVNSKKEMIHEYGMYMYEHEYKKYTFKQWGIPIEKIDLSVFMRVPVYLSYKSAYLMKKYQFMPQGGFANLAVRMLDNPNIRVELCSDALPRLQLEPNEGRIYFDDHVNIPIVYTGPLDALFAFCYGKLPYRALEFVWKTIDAEKGPPTPLSAFPETDKYIRITDYTQFPPQKADNKSVIAIEFPIEYDRSAWCGNEPYYPVLTEASETLISQYRLLAEKFVNLFPCGRLADFKYYNMDQAINRAIDVWKHVQESLL